MSPAEMLLVSLLSLYNTNAVAAACIEHHRAAIVENADRAESEEGVPAGVLLTIAYLETHLACTRGGGASNWGAPISRVRRDVNGTAFHAAHALRWSYEVCGNWTGAIHRFRCGLCHCPHLVGYQPDYAAWVIRRVYSRAGMDLPAPFDRRDAARQRASARADRARARAD